MATKSRRTNNRKRKKTSTQRKRINAKRDYKKEYNRDQKKRTKYRSKLNQENRRRGDYGNGDGKDLSHTKTGKMVKESQSKNRARNGKNGKSTKK